MQTPGVAWLGRDAELRDIGERVGRLAPLTDRHAEWSGRHVGDTRADGGGHLARLLLRHGIAEPCRARRRAAANCRSCARAASEQHPVAESCRFRRPSRSLSAFRNLKAGAGGQRAGHEKKEVKRARSEESHGDKMPQNESTPAPQLGAIRPPSLKKCMPSLSRRRKRRRAAAAPRGRTFPIYTR